MALTEAEALELAQRIVIRLCGNRWVFPPVRMVDVYPIPQSRMVYVSGRPIVEIHSVKVGDEPVDTVDYQVYNQSSLLLARSVAVPVNCGKRATLEIEYTYGVSALPDIMERAIEVMQKELLAADSDDAECRIPERVTSVTRQGVSWTMIDPQDFLDAGRTGIYEVDLAIKVMNPSKARARARVFTTTTSAPPIRRAP